MIAIADETILGAPSVKSSKITYLQNQIQLLSEKANYNEALKTAEQVLEFSLQLKDPYHIAEAYYAIAKVQSQLGAHNLAAANSIKALKVSEGLNNKREQAKYYLTLAHVFFTLRDSKKLLFYTSKGYAIAQELNDPDLIATYRLQISIDEIFNGALDKALVHLKESERIFLAKKDIDQLSSTYLYFRHVYFAKKDYATALFYLKKIMPLLPNVQKKAERFRVHVESAMAETYMKLGEYEKAKYYFDRNIGRIRQFMDGNDVKEMYHIGATIYEHTGKPNIALQYLKQYKVVNDSANNVLMKKAIHETEIKYQTSIKEKAISEQKLQLANKNNELQQKNKYIIFGAIAFIVLILGAIIIYLIYRNKNQAIELSLLKAQIHPHFLFNTLNNLYALTMSKADEAPGVVLGLSSILRYILYECNTLKVDLKKEMDMIATYISLEQTRYEHRLEVNINIDGDLSDKQIAPLLILPLVENAFKHGVSKLVNDAFINIEAKVKGNKFIFKISNNKPEETKKDLDSSKYGNIGLLNIQRRLNILYPKKHHLKITTDEEIFLVVMELVI